NAIATVLPGKAARSTLLPRSQALEELALRLGRRPFLERVGGRIALQGPQCSLHLGNDALAFVVDRRPLRGQNLPVLEQVVELLPHFIDLVRWNLGGNVLLEKLVEL